MSSRTITVRCPDCGAALVVDPQNGQILGHEKKDKKAPPDQAVFDKAFGKVAAGPKSSFDKAFESLEKKKATLDDRLEEAKRRAAESPDETPRSPFDLE
jgi:hypothetical protein